MINLKLHRLTSHSIYNNQIDGYAFEGTMCVNFPGIIVSLNGSKN